MSLRQGPSRNFFKATETSRLPVAATASKIISTENSTSTPLNNGAVFEGTYTNGGPSELLVVGVADQRFKLHVDFSLDNGNTTFLTKTRRVEANLPFEFRFNNTGSRYRIRVENDSGANMLSLVVETYYGDIDITSVSLKDTVPSQADAIVVRSTPPETDVAAGKISGRSIILRGGRNPNVVNTVSLAAPQDVWNGGGAYTGFPVNDIETFTITSSSSADIGTVRFYALESPTSREYVLVEAELPGGTPNTVTTGGTYWRATDFEFDNGSATGFNQGTITVTHSTTTANIFAVVPIGFSKSQIMAFTIPKDNAGIIKNLRVTLSPKNTGNLNGAVWVRLRNRSPILFEPFVISQSVNFVLDTWAGAPIPELTDFAIRIYQSDASNTVSVLGRGELELILNPDV